MTTNQPGYLSLLIGFPRNWTQRHGDCLAIRRARTRLIRLALSLLKSLAPGAIRIIWRFPKMGGTPKFPNHPFIDGISIINHPAIGVHPVHPFKFMETPIWAGFF